MEVSRHEPYFRISSSTYGASSKDNNSDRQRKRVGAFRAKCDRPLYWMTASIEEKRTNHVIQSTPLNRVVRPSKIHSKILLGKIEHFPSQGGAHFNLEELNNNATGSIERVWKILITVETTTHMTLSIFFTLFSLIGQRTAGCWSLSTQRGRVTGWGRRDSNPQLHRLP